MIPKTRFRRRSRGAHTDEPAIEAGFNGNGSNQPPPALASFDADSRESAVRDQEGPQRIRRRRFRPPRVIQVLLVLVALAIASAAVYQLESERDRFEEELSSARDLMGAREGSARTRIAALEDEVGDLRLSLEELQRAKVRTIVKEKPVVREVVRWMPNGEGIEVELTGFKGSVAIHDVQLTHMYGYSDLVGIAINKTGRVISYAQIGCTFLAADGSVIANAIDNRNNWAPGASWGFDCSAEVDATGGIVRVDQMS